MKFVASRGGVKVGRIFNLLQGRLRGGFSQQSGLLASVRCAYLILDLLKRRNLLRHEIDQFYQKWDRSVSNRSDIAFSELERLRQQLGL